MSRGDTTTATPPNDTTSKSSSSSSLIFWDAIRLLGDDGGSGINHQKKNGKGRGAKNGSNYDSTTTNTSSTEQIASSSSTNPTASLKSQHIAYQQFQDFCKFLCQKGCNDDYFIVDDAEKDHGQVKIRTGTDRSTGTKSSLLVKRGTTVSSRNSNHNHRRGGHPKGAKGDESFSSVCHKDREEKTVLYQNDEAFILSVLFVHASSSSFLDTTSTKLNSKNKKNSPTPQHRKRSLWNQTTALKMKRVILKMQYEETNEEEKIVKYEEDNAPPIPMPAPRVGQPLWMYEQQHYHHYTRNGTNYGAMVTPSATVLKQRWLPYEDGSYERMDKQEHEDFGNKREHQQQEDRSRRKRKRGKHAGHKDSASPPTALVLDDGNDDKTSSSRNYLKTVCL